MHIVFQTLQFTNIGHAATRSRQIRFTLHNSSLHNRTLTKKEHLIDIPHFSLNDVTESATLILASRCWLGAQPPCSLALLSSTVLRPRPVDRLQYYTPYHTTTITHAPLHSSRPPCAVSNHCVDASWQGFTQTGVGC